MIACSRRRARSGAVPGHPGDSKLWANRPDGWTWRITYEAVPAVAAVQSDAVFLEKHLPNQL